TDDYVEEMNEIVGKIQSNKKSDKPVLTKKQLNAIDELESWTNKLQSPLQHLEHKMHTWVAYYIIPLFALANAGVSFGTDLQIDLQLASTVALSLVLGKMIGVFAFSYIGIKLKVCTLPGDLKLSQIFGASVLAGLGFTMAIFIANLAFKDQPIYIESAKIGILVASIVAGVCAYLILLVASKKQNAN
ncbi:MAG: Na+/H+ antiporter NhaA, partial [Bacteroidia bacterium]|nr:Na+/H+ antiporter NhaA [Bacteroidia bacterium]